MKKFQVHALFNVCSLKKPDQGGNTPFGTPIYALWNANLSVQSTNILFKMHNLSFTTTFDKKVFRVVSDLLYLSF